jgi:hypothetical protein
MSEMEDMLQTGTHEGRVADARLAELVLLEIKTGEG